MDRPKRPFFSSKTTKKDESPPQDKVPMKKSFKDKVDFFEKSTDSKDSLQDAGKFRNNFNNNFNTSCLLQNDCDQTWFIGTSLNVRHILFFLVSPHTYINVFLAMF